jgi:phosphoribosylformylglycinamidine synthase
MSSHFIIFFKESDEYVCFWDISVNKNIDRSLLVRHLGISEMYYSIKRKEETIVTTKPEVKSQLISSAESILNLLNLEVLFLRKCRVYKNNEVVYDPLLEQKYLLEEYVDTYTEINFEDTPESYDLSTTCIDIHDDKLLACFDEQELKYYRELFKKLQRNPTYTEYYDILQSNSEHARHWFFNGNYFYKNKFKKKKVKDENGNDSLMKMIKSTLYNIDRYSVRMNSLVAFKDNSSVIKGKDTVYFTSLSSNNYYFISRRLNPVLTAETHNFPTLLSPFHGAHTGVGGRIRDNQATGIGAIVLGSLAGYCVGDIYTELNENPLNKLDDYGDYPTPLKILIEASNGASDYGNKFGEPIIGGFTRSFSTRGILDGNDNPVERVEWLKPIMFSAGVGAITERNTFKKKPEVGMYIVRIGGPAYKIGLGGGYASSLDQNNESIRDDSSSIQRGDPEMCTKMNNALRYLMDTNKDNIIISIHDQGSGGLGNVLKEIVAPLGANIFLNNVTLGDKTMTGWEIWCSEFQESNVMVVEKKSLNELEYICKRENICCDILGTLNNDTNIVVEYKRQNILNLPLNEIVNPNLKKEYILEKTNHLYLQKEIKPTQSTLFYPFLSKVLQNVDVCSKRFLVNKVDRSVTGLVVQQQCVGPFHTPISNYNIMSFGYFDNHGVVSAIGEKPILTLLNTEAAGTMAVAEMVTNMMGACVGNLNLVKCSGNWMWALSKQGASEKLVCTAKAMVETMKFLALSIDGGKDSLSMTASTKKSTVNSPDNLVITGYAHTVDFNKRVTPELKKTGSQLVYIKFSNKVRLGGSVYQREQGKMGGETPNLDMNGLAALSNTWDVIQEMIYENKILSLHDVSDGGLITTICEMAIAGNLGVNIFIKQKEPNINNYLFNEEAGIVVEVRQPNFHKLCKELKKFKIEYTNIGVTKQSKDITIKNNYELFTSFSLDNVREFWETTSNKLEYKQMSKEKAEQQENLRYYSNFEGYYLPPYISEECNYKPFINILNDGPRVAIIRTEGSNGHREMAAAFATAQFSTVDLHMNDLLETPELLDTFVGIAFVGGFSYSDTFGAAKGWGSLITCKPELKESFDRFFNRKDTFSIGVCNGCQLMMNFNLFGDYPRIKLVQNDSKRFESRFSTVKVTNSNSIFFKNMAELEFGMWVAHGEGKFVNVSPRDNIALQYSHESSPTMLYPYNPNGSEHGTAAISSRCGRHLAIMPHPERCFLKWQLPYCGYYEDILESPWVYIFRNAYRFVKKNSKKK